MTRNRPHWFAQGVFTIGLFFAASVAIMEEYKSLQGHGYALEHRAELDNKIKGLVPLSISDLGMDAE